MSMITAHQTLCTRHISVMNPYKWYIFGHAPFPLYIIQKYIAKWIFWRDGARKFTFSVFDYILVNFRSKGKNYEVQKEMFEGFYFDHASISI